MIAGDAICMRAIAMLEVEDASAPSPYELLINDPDAEINYVLIAQPDDAAGDPVNVYLSSRGLVSANTDTPPRTLFPARLRQPYNFEISLSPPTDPVGASSSFGVIELINPDGALDSYEAMNWSGRPLEVRIGGRFNVGRADERTLTLAEYATIFKGTVDNLALDEDSITLALRDPAVVLDDPVQSRLYAGTGGDEGGPDLAGQPIPKGWGLIRNANPPLIDGALLIYQLHDGRIESIDEVRDKGIALISDGDTANLAAWVPVAGHYKTDRSRGKFRLGAKAAGQITVDFHGDADPTYEDSPAGLAYRIVQSMGFEADDIDINSFLDFPFGGAVHYWTGLSRPSANDVIADLLGSVDGRMVWTRLARVSLVALRTPEEGMRGAREPIKTLIIERGTLQRDRKLLPRWRYSIGWGYLQITQTADQLADALTAAQKAFYELPYTFETANDPTIKAAHPLARDEEVTTRLTDQEDAEAEAERRLARDGIPRGVWRASAIRQFLQLKIGDVVQLQNPRYGLEDGRPMQIIGIADEARTRKMNVTLWG